MRLLEDALERALAVPDRPLRIVSLVPSITELLFDLGVGERVVGVSRYCTEPGDIIGLPRVGGQKDPDLPAILALAPDLVIAVKEENLARDVDALAAQQVAVYVADVQSVEEALALPGEIGDLVDAAPSVVEPLASASRAGVAGARAKAARRGRELRVFCPVWRDPWIALSSDTYMGDVLRVCGALAVPPGRHDRRYPKVTLDDVRAAHPDAILLPDEPYPFGPADAAELAAIAPVRLVDGKLLAWYGRRTACVSSLCDLLDEASAAATR